MIIIAVDFSDISRWLNELEDINRRTPGAIAKGLNTFGQSVVDEVAQYVAESTGLGDNEVAMMIQVDWATPDDLNLTIDATEALAATQEADWSRPWDARDQKQYEKQTLLQIVTLNDGHDCPVCQAAAAASPYSAEDIQNLQAKWAHFQGSTGGPAPGVRTNLIHPNCRCQVVPWQSITSMSPTTGQSRTPPDLFNTQNMARVVMDAYKLELRLK
jgi:hypothetical protein